MYRQSYYWHIKLLFISNVPSVVDHSATCAIDELAVQLVETSALLNISDITQSSDHLKSSSISQFFKDKSIDLQKLLKYFNGTTTSLSNTSLLAGVIPNTFFLFSKD